MSLEIKENAKVYKLDQEYIITKVIDFNYVFAKHVTTFEKERLAIKDLSSNQHLVYKVCTQFLQE